MSVEIHLKRWGNSLGLRIPKGIAESAGLQVDDAVRIDATPEGLVVRKARRRPVLAELLGRVTSENRHAADDLGGAKGRELL